MAGIHVIFQAGLPFHDYQGADPFPGHITCCTYDLFHRVDCIFVGFGERGLPDLGQGSPDIALEDNDYDQEDRTQKGVEDPVESLEFKEFCPEVGEDYYADTRQHLRGSGPFDDEEDPIYYEPDDQDVEEILPAERCDEIKH